MLLVVDGFRHDEVRHVPARTRDLSRHPSHVSASSAMMDDLSDDESLLGGIAADEDGVAGSEGEVECMVDAGKDS